MIMQLDLFERTLVEEFEAWLATDEGAEVSDEFTATAVALHASGQREGARAIWEHLRWTTRRRMGGTDGDYPPQSLALNHCNARFCAPFIAISRFRFFVAACQMRSTWRVLTRRGRMHIVSSCNGDNRQQHGGRGG